MTSAAHKRCYHWDSLQTIIIDFNYRLLIIASAMLPLKLQGHSWLIQMAEKLMELRLHLGDSTFEYVILTSCPDGKDVMHQN